LNKPLLSSLLAPRPGAAALPPVDRVLALGFVPALVARFGRTAVNAAVRTVLEDKRQRILGGAKLQSVWPADEAWLEPELRRRLESASAARLRRVFNLTGTVLHTNLGRALLPESAIEAATTAMRSAVNLEYDLESGTRGERDELVEELLRETTGAEAATVVNNNAAAVLLALNSLAHKREVIVSRGELIEIGGAFRLPDIMARAGVKLIEVGTTNRTHLHDYEHAIGAKTALLAKVHTSNFAMQGFTAAVTESALATLAHGCGLPLMVDLGSGALLDLRRWGLPSQPTLAESIRADADLVTFSGDKLLGGPQAGILVGRAKLIERIRKNPLRRALRVDKVTLAALEAVLQLYRAPETLAHHLPTLRLLTRSRVELRGLGERLLAPMQDALAGRAEAALRNCESQTGSGSLPVDRLPSVALVLVPLTKGRGSGTALKALEAGLRKLPVPVIGRVQEGALWLDLRCLEDEAAFVQQLPVLRAA
jgi:L-seryl-tRNA(Ser) seleniumtransferase